MLSRRLAVGFVLAIAGVCLGQMKPAPHGTAPAAAPAEDAPPASVAPAATAPAELAPLKLFLMDGSQVAGKLSISDLMVDTQFGTLKVPLDAIKSFTPGISSHPDFDKKVSDLVADLGADGFAEREKAQQGLMKIGPSIAPELRRLVKTAEAERQTRLQKILEDFDAQHEGDDDADAPAANSGDWTRDDVIVTTAFTIVGHITTTSFAATSSYGTLQLKLADIRTAARAAAEPEDVRKTVTVSGTLISTRGFDGALKVNKGDQITITATGSITMTPWGGGAATGPDGNNQYGTMQPGNIPTGALMAKIGAGTPFKVGSKKTFTADKSGELSFGIAMQNSYMGNEFPGEYQVKIRVGHK